MALTARHLVVVVDLKLNLKTMPESCMAENTMHNAQRTTHNAQHGRHSSRCKMSVAQRTMHNAQCTTHVHNAKQTHTHNTKRTRTMHDAQHTMQNTQSRTHNSQCTTHNAQHTIPSNVCTVIFATGVPGIV